MTRYKLGTLNKAMAFGEAIYNTDLENPIEEPQEALPIMSGGVVVGFTNPKKVEKLRTLRNTEGLSPEVIHEIDRIIWKLDEHTEILNSIRKSEARKGER